MRCCLRIRSNCMSADDIVRSLYPKSLITRWIACLPRQLELMRLVEFFHGVLPGAQ
jgi:hypothetical protein